MSVSVSASQGAALLAAIKKAIDERKIETWSYDKDGDFTHTPVQWRNKAWLRPKVETGRLVFGLLGPKDTTMTSLVYGTYHGRFIEMLLVHFDTQFTAASATALRDPAVDNFRT